MRPCPGRSLRCFRRKCRSCPHRRNRPPSGGVLRRTPERWPAPNRHLCSSAVPRRPNRARGRQGVSGCGPAVRFGRPPVRRGGASRASVSFPAGAFSCPAAAVCLSGTVSSPSVFATARTGCGVFAPDTVCGGSEPASVSGTAVSPVPSGSTTAVCRTAASSVIPAGRER